MVPYQAIYGTKLIFAQLLIFQVIREVLQVLCVVQPRVLIQNDGAF